MPAARSRTYQIALQQIKRHRLTIIIDKGRVLEQGTRHDLLDRRGLFYAFYQAQKLDRDGKDDNRTD